MKLPASHTYNPVMGFGDLEDTILATKSIPIYNTHIRDANNALLNFIDGFLPWSFAFVLAVDDPSRVETIYTKVLAINDHTINLC